MTRDDVIRLLRRSGKRSALNDWLVQNPGVMAQIESAGRLEVSSTPRKIPPARWLWSPGVLRGAVLIAGGPARGAHWSAGPWIPRPATPDGWGASVLDRIWPALRGFALVDMFGDA